jgi:hypothetical protein
MVGNARSSPRAFDTTRVLAPVGATRLHGERPLTRKKKVGSSCDVGGTSSACGRTLTSGGSGSELRQRRKYNWRHRGRYDNSKDQSRSLTPDPEVCGPSVRTCSLVP